MTPLVAVVLPLCAMAADCPMMGQMGAASDCHGERLSALDCCSMGQMPGVPERVPGIGVPIYDLGLSILARAKLELPVVGKRVDPTNGRTCLSDRPLYTLYDTLLI